MTFQLQTTDTASALAERTKAEAFIVSEQKKESARLAREDSLRGDEDARRAIIDATKALLPLENLAQDYK